MSGLSPGEARRPRERPGGEDYTNTYGQTEGRLAAYELGGDGRPVQRLGYLPDVRIPHTDRVDDLLKQVVEALIAVRYAHPTLVQLHLELPEPQP
ncbi:MAG TPA: hypothetical protein ENK17_03560 [Anaerolineae bacterium]|nr:hypothetical protein [Anaerolineae bacterium]